MLKYFVDTSEQLITAALLAGLALGWSHLAYGKAGRLIVRICTIAGILSAGVMSYLKNATRKIDTSMWTLRIFIVSLAALLLFIILTAVSAGLRKKKPKASGALSTAAAVLLGITAFGVMLYSLPDILAYPYTILLVEKSVLSTTFILKVIGIIFGMLLVFLAGLAVNHGLRRMKRGTAFTVLTLAMLLNAVRQVTMCLRIMITKRMIQSNTTLFNIVKYSSNNERLYIYGAMLISLSVPVILYIMSCNVNEPYSNPAQHRKIRYKWKVTRRWAVLAVLAPAMVVLNMTAVYASVNKVVELSPVEDAEVRDGAVYVTFEQVADGHLHRFGYVTENDVQIRFIVIKKPNSSSYGVGLDACDICGETGYYEKDGQVVCKLCDVVMNINTIGFKGGCNPIVIPYTIENGNIVVPIEGLVEYEKEFK